MQRRALGAIRASNLDRPLRYADLDGAFLPVDLEAGADIAGHTFFGLDQKWPPLMADIEPGATRQQMDDALLVIEIDGQRSAAIQHGGGPVRQGNAAHFAYGA